MPETPESQTTDPMDWAKIDAMITERETAPATPAPAPSPSATPPPADRASGTIEPAGGDSAPSPATNPGGEAPPTPTPTPKPDTPSDPPASKPADKPPSRFEKERARQQNQWQQIAAEKERLARERAEFEAERKRLAQEREATSKARFSKAQYEQAAEGYAAEAKRLEDAGDFDRADEARALAKLARNAAAQAPATAEPAAAPAATPNLDAALTASWTKAKAELPAVLEKGSPLNAAVSQFLQSHPALFEQPDGPYLAVKACAAALESVNVAGLAAEREAQAKEITTLKARVKELEAATSVAAAAGPTGATSQARFEDLPLDEQRRQLKQALALEKAA